MITISIPGYTFTAPMAHGTPDMYQGTYIPFSDDHSNNDKPWVPFPHPDTEVYPKYRTTFAKHMPIGPSRASTEKGFVSLFRSFCLLSPNRQPLRLAPLRGIGPPYWKLGTQHWDRTGPRANLRRTLHSTLSIGTVHPLVLPLDRYEGHHVSPLNIIPTDSYQGQHTPSRHGLQCRSHP